MIWEHKKLGMKIEAIEVEELLQAQVEAFFRIKRRLSGNNEVNLSVMETVGNVCRAAREVEIVKSGYTVEDVDKMTPAKTTWLSEKISNHIAEALKVPPE